MTKKNFQEITDIKEEKKNILNDEIIDRLIPDTGYDVDVLEKKYHERNIPVGARVTRISPSPTGSMHIGGTYTAFISERIAHSTNGGIFYLRIEDTDQKREQHGTREMIMMSLHKFGINYDEGDMEDGSVIGEYGPYTQSKRAQIYKTYVKGMLKNGLAYPCFMTNDEQEQMRAQQTKQSVKTGYYGTWAIWRNAKQEEVVTELDSGKPFVVRYRSDGNPNQRIIVNDLIRGRLELPEDNNDIVLLKSDGLPTYHFAHIIDDHLMRTTTVIRGDEWLSSLPLHVQLSKVLGFKPFEYGHLSTIQKIDENGSRRKLSKRKDPEASVEYYFSHGYPVEAVKDYLMNIANPGFEMWRKENPDKTYIEYEFSIEKIPSTGGGLLDLTKLNDVSKEFIGEMSADEIVTRSIAWSKEFDIQLYEILTSDVEYAKKVFSIERGESAIKKRKDIAYFSQIKDQYGLFFKKYFDEMVFGKEVIEKISSFNKDDIKNIIDSFIDTYNETDNNAIWFDKVKVISEKLGYTTNLKEYRKNPEKFKGSVIDVANILRAAITKRFQSPDLCDIMKTIGKDETMVRLASAIKLLG